MKIVLPALARPLLEPELPAGHHIRWFGSSAEADEMIADADIAWVDQMQPAWTAATVAQGERLRWLSTLYAGLDALDLDLLAERGTIVTNGSGINAVAVAEYAVLGILAAAKRYDEVVRLSDRQQWTTDPPGRTELAGTRALIVGLGTIGQLIARRLAAFDVATTGVTRTGRGDTLLPDQWRGELGTFDWVILAAPSTPGTRSMIGTAELSAMKRNAWLINIARGDMIEQAALLEALRTRTIAGAFLDPTDPEPLPAGHPLWTAPNTLLSLHLSGRSQTHMFARAAALFLHNLDAFLHCRPMENVVDLQAGY